MITPRWVLTVCCTAVLSSCTVLSSPADSEDTELLGMIQDARLPEISGLAASLRTPGYWWALNDSGNPALLFALDAKGAVRTAFTVPGSKNVDWEDLACTAGPGGSSLWIADTGDAGGSRKGGILYRVPEPVIGTAATGTTEAAAAFPFTWPDGPRDCECLLVDAREGTGLLVTKLFLKPGKADVYQFALPAGPGARLALTRVEPAAAESVRALRTLTGGSVSADGRRLAVRTYSGGWVWDRAAGEPLARVFTRAPLPVSLPAVLQGEAIAFSPDGRALVTSSERLPAPFYRTAIPTRKP